MYFPSYLSSSTSSIKTHEECKHKQDPEKITFNYPNIFLSEAEKFLLVKGLKVHQ